MSTFITGYSLRAPNVSNPNEFYEAIRDKVDLTAPSRRYPEGYLDLPPRAGTLPNIDRFDNEFFKYNIKQTDKMDIIIRLLLEVTHECLLDAKISIPTLRGSRTGVYIGHCFSDYLSRTAGNDIEKDGYELVNGAHAMAANKISFFYDLKGPSLVFDTACSSSLVALHQANQDLKAGLIDRAIVGGASLTLDPNKNKVFQAYSMLSPTGRCHSFDARADGYCRSEGIAVVLLESPSVCSSGLAQVLGSSVNSDGFTAKGITFPSGRDQAANARAAFLAAQELPEVIGYVEAHGTGTVAGDSQELGGLVEVLYAGANDRAEEGLEVSPAAEASSEVSEQIPAQQVLLPRRIPIGSVKSVMGHAEGASGLMSLIKVLLMYEHKQLLPNQLFDYNPGDPESTNPHAAIKDGYFEVVTTTAPWEPAPACISNYGFGGTNAFAIVAPGNVVTTTSFVPVDAAGVVAAAVACAASSLASSAISDACTAVSAASSAPRADGAVGPAGLRTSAEDASWVPSFGSQATSVADSSWFQEQSALGNDLFYAYRGGRKVTARPSQAKVALVYSGQGSQWAEMGCVLVQSNAIFRDTIKRLDGYARKVDDALRLWEWFSGETEETGASELDTPAAPSKAASWMNKERSGLGIAAYQIGLTNMLQAANLHPDFVLGHSLGEVGACYAAGLQTEQQTIEIAIVRSGLSAYILPDTYMLKTRSCLNDSDLMRVGVVSAIYNPAILANLSTSDADPPKENFHFYYVHHADQLPVEYVRAECGEILFDLNGSMGAVGLESAVIQQAIDELGLTQTCVACYNSPQGQTVSGAAPEVKRLKAHLEKQHKDLFWRDVPTDKVAYHAPHLTCHYDLLVSQFSAILGESKKVVPAHFVCTSTNITASGVNDTPVLLDAHFHARNIVNPVYFQQALESLPKDTLIVEVGPHQGLLGQIKRVRSDFSTLGLVKANSPASELQVASALGKLFWEAGYNKHVYDPTKVNRATRLPLSQRHPDLWNHTRVQKIFDYTDFELMYVKSDGKGVISSANSAASLIGGGFEVRYDVSGEHKFLLDHCIQGQSLFPATGHLYSLWSAIGLDKGVNISEFEILQAVALDPAVMLVFVVHKAGNDFTITHEGNVVARAVILLVSEASPVAGVPPEAALAVMDDTTAAASNQLLDGNSLYNHFKRYGYDYKTAFRLVKHRTLPASLRTPSDENAVPVGSCVDGYAVLNTAVHVIAWLDVMLQLFLDDLCLLRLPTLLKRVHLRPSLLTAALKDQSSIVYMDTPTKRLFNEHALFQELHTLPTTKARVACQLVHSVQTFVPLGVHLLSDQHTLAQVESAANWMAAQLSAYLSVHPEQITAKPWLQNVLQHATKRCAAMPAEAMSLNDCETNPLSAIAAHVYVDLDSMLNNPLRCISLAPEHEIFYSRDDNRAFAAPVGLLEQLVSLVAQEWEHSTQATKGLRVLEGGVGTGGLTRRLWPVLSPVLDTYTGMDVSAIVPGDEISRDKRFETLHHDLNDPLPALAEDQVDQNYHLFCASNAIHVTKNIATTLRQLITRMHDGGYLLLEEFVDNDFCLYLWGLDPAIWSFPCSDAPRSYGLWMSWTEWQEVVAQVPELDIVVAVRTEVRLTLLLRYRSAGLKAATMAIEDKHAWSDLSPAAAPAQRFVSDGALALFRTLAKEHSAITMHTATLDASDFRSAEVFRSALVQCPLRHLAVHRLWSGAWVTTSAEAAACAMEASTDADATADAAVDTVATSGLVTESNSALSLSIKRPGDLSSLAWVHLPLRLTASNQDSLVNVEFSGLNFKDVMYAFGKLRLETPSFGLEVSGHNLQGERVMGIGRCNCIATRTILDMTWKIPEQWSLADAATVPVVYLTALYAMFHKARLQPGQTMLVHGGAGGVGHAAIHLAQRQGIEVFTTCSQSKRAHLKQWFGLDDAHIGNSRDLTFVDLVLRGTNGQGVDMVLNCLSGAALNSSLTLVKEYGNFCEIGKFDLQTNTHIGLKVFERNVGYYAIDLATMFAHSHYSKVLVKLLQNALDNGDLRPLPYEVYAAVDAADALRYLSAGKQVGKVLIGMQNAAELANSSTAPVSSKSFKTILPSARRIVFTTTGTHVITGGLGGFGMELAHWLVQCGATRIVLTSRTGKLVTGWQQMRFTSLQNNPLLEEVIISTLDVGDSVQCEHLISTYTADSSKPLRGVWHAAMVLEDVTFAKQTAERWANVHYAKSVACAYLDRACRSHAPALQVFCAFSSVVALQGNIGQAAYAHANAACERIIQQRNADGLCGVAVQWGAIDNVGFVSQNATQVETSIAQYALQNIDDSLNCLHQWAQHTGVVSAYCELHQENTPAGNEGAVGVSVVEDVQAKFASILGGKAGDYDPDTPVQSYGLDSLSSTVLVNWINNNQMKGSAHGHITAEFFNDAMTIRKMFTYMTA